MKQMWKLTPKQPDLIQKKFSAIEIKIAYREPIRQKSKIKNKNLIILRLNIKYVEASITSTEAAIECKIERVRSQKDKNIEDKHKTENIFLAYSISIKESQNISPNENKYKASEEGDVKTSGSGIQGKISS